MRSIRGSGVLALALVVAAAHVGLSQKAVEVSGEITMAVTGLSAEQDWVVRACSQSPVRWSWDGGTCPLTSEYAFAQVTGHGNADSYGSFKCPIVDWPGQTLAFGDYEFTFDLPPGYRDVSFCLDLRDADWTAGYDSPKDVWVRCHITTPTSSYLEWKRGSGGTYSAQMVGSIWEMFGRRTPNHARLQPTPPLQFTCSNAGEAGANPRFTWEEPIEPGGVSHLYRVYRKRPSQSWRCVVSDLTVREWIDEEVTIDPARGVTYWYCATAYTSQSIESPPRRSCRSSAILASPVTTRQAPLRYRVGRQPFWSTPTPAIPGPRCGTWWPRRER
ncbi:MAG: hypothetical protein H5U38_00115 [Calditrichaeota bacterium]|nr:hypothetical protein [Calditrichota bacterium]